MCVFPSHYSENLAPAGVGVGLKHVALCGLLACVGHGQRPDALSVWASVVSLRCSPHCKFHFALNQLLPPPFSGIASYAGQAGPVWPLDKYHDVSCGRACPVRDLDCFLRTFFE